MALSRMPGGKTPGGITDLSQREMQVMMMVVQGHSIQDISDKLFISPKTVNTYRYRLFEKLAVNNDVELTRLAMRHGLIDVNAG
jgi:two-component system invasion response regulator UvrY